MSALFPHANLIAGVCVFLVGFCFHWLGQLISVLDWRLATRLGLQEANMLPAYKVYEHAIAVADSAVAWLYGVAAVGLLLDAAWGYQLAWIPGSLLVYHAICAWVWEGNRRAAGHGLWRQSLRIGWCAANGVTGVLALLVAAAGKAT